MRGGQQITPDALIQRLDELGPRGAGHFDIISEDRSEHLAGAAVPRSPQGGAGPFSDRTFHEASNA